MNSAGKEEVSNGPAHGPPLQARVAAANRTVLQLANMLVFLKILAHMDMNRGKQSKMNGAKQTERGQDVDEGSGHGRQRVDRHTAC